MIRWSKGQILSETIAFCQKHLSEWSTALVLHAVIRQKATLASSLLFQAKQRRIQRMDPSAKVCNGSYNYLLTQRTLQVCDFHRLGILKLF